MDKTGFGGLLDMQLEFSQDGAAEGLSLFTAIQDLGLKLESAKAPLGVVVIESRFEFEVAGVNSPKASAHLKSHLTIRAPIRWRTHSCVPRRDSSRRR